MKIDYRKLQESEWDTLFKIEKKTKGEILILLNKLTIDEAEFQNLRMKFENPNSEWASLWNEEKKDWEEHQDLSMPIGDRITAFAVKPAGKNLKFSFGGEHALGWARWGFSTSNFELIVEKERNES